MRYALSNPFKEHISDLEGSENLTLVPSAIYCVSINGLSIDYRLSERIRIAQKIEELEINDFLFFHGNEPVYAYTKKDDGEIAKFPIPDQESIETSSVELYAKGVTNKQAWVRLIRRRLKKGNDRMSQTSKMVWVLGLIGLFSLIILMITVSLMSDPKPEDVGPVPQTEVTTPSGDKSTTITIPDEPKTVTPTKAPAKGVPVP